jgi:TonB-dependent SusC/RagA subfamily outer membrane receptor
MASPVLVAQTRVVYGKLTAFNRYPLQNVQVMAKKTKASVKSDSLGIFCIVCREKDVIKIRPKAFQAVTRRVNRRTDTLKINLIFLDSEANRKLATGYGYIDEQDLTFAMSHLEYENNDFCNYSSVYELIAGRFPGVTVNHRGTGGSVVIRGENSINASTEALYVVDGMVMESIDWVRPCDVRSIDVIKDGMSAMYGSRGAGGVVVIETKQGGQ